MSALQHVQAALAGFQAQQSVSSPAYIDLLAAVEFCERAVPRLYMSTISCAVLLEAYQPGGQIGTILYETAEEMVMDLSRFLCAVRHPLKSIHLRLFALHSTSPWLNKLDMSTSSLFLVDMFEEMERMWVRYGYQGEQSGFEGRQRERAGMLDLVMAPLRVLSELKLTDEVYRERVCPKILQHLSDSEDGPSQNMIFHAILATFPASWHAATSRELIAALQQFSPADLQDGLQAMVARILDDSEDVTVIRELWENIKKLVEKSASRFRTESDLITLAAYFLGKLRLSTDSQMAGLMEDIFNTLQRCVSDKSSPVWRALLSELTRQTTDISLLLGSASFMRCLCLNTPADFATSVHLVHRWCQAKDVGQLETLAEVISSVFAKSTIEENEASFLETVSEIRVLPRAQKNIFRLLLDSLVTNPDDLSLCFYIRSLLSTIDLSSDEEQVSWLELFRDAKHAVLDTGFEELAYMFGPDGPALQYVLVMLDQARKSAGDVSGLYACLSKAIMTAERSFDSSLAHHQALSRITHGLDKNSSLLRVQDLEVLLQNLVKISGRQLDIGYRVFSLLNALKIVAKRSLSVDLSLEALSKTLLSVRVLQKSRSQHVLTLMSLSIGLFSRHPTDLIRLADPLNSLFWEERDRCPVELQHSYSEAWAAWSAVVPTSRLGEVDATVVSPTEESAVKDDKGSDAEDATSSTHLASVLTALDLEDDTLYGFKSK